MEFNPTFNIEKFENYVADFLYSTNYFDVDYYVSKVHSNNQVYIQTVFVLQGNYDTRTNDVANRLLEEIENGKHREPNVFSYTFLRVLFKFQMCH